MVWLDFDGICAPWQLDDRQFHCALCEFSARGPRAPSELDRRGCCLGARGSGRTHRVYRWSRRRGKTGRKPEGNGPRIWGCILGQFGGRCLVIPYSHHRPRDWSFGGGAAGTFAGAFYGEEGTGRTQAERLAIGKAAMRGRLLETAGKLVIGIVMLVLVTLDSI
jgi:hypothetical protein